MVRTPVSHRSLRRRTAQARHPGVRAARCEESARIRGQKGVRRGGRPLPDAARPGAGPASPAPR